MASQRSIERAIALLSEPDAALRAKHTWLAGPGYRGLALGKRMRRGKETTETVLKVLVAKKLPLAGSDAEIPASVALPGIKGKIPVDIEEVGDTDLQLALPAAGGAPIAVKGGGQGDLACLVFREHGDAGVSLLSCSHVLGYNFAGELEHGTPVFALDPLQAGMAGARPIGALSDYHPLNFEAGRVTAIDAAIARLESQQVLADIDGIGPPTGLNMSPRIGDTMFAFIRGAWSAAKPLKNTNVTVNNVRMKFSGGNRTLTYIGMLACEKFSLPGDSGAAVVDRFHRLVGLVVGADKSNSSSARTFICPIGRILQRFGVRPVTTDTLEQARALLATPVPHSAPLDGFKRVAKAGFSRFAHANINTNMRHIMAALRAVGLGDRLLVLMALATIRAESHTFTPITEPPHHLNTSGFGTPSQGPDYDLYENRGPLGNTEPGDGARFCGRGFVQLTGRWNYRRIGEDITVDLIGDPELANDPVVASRILAAFLKRREGAIRVALAENDMARARSLVNGGHHGLEAFTASFALMSAAWRQVFG
jgi:hypothetical protein